MTANRREGPRRIRSRVLGSLSLHTTQLAVYLGHDVMFGSTLVKHTPVRGGIARPKQQMNRCIGTVSTSTTAHLVELYLRKRHAVENHMAHIGNINALAES